LLFITLQANAQMGWEYAGKIATGGASLHDSEGRNRGVGIETIGDVSASENVKANSLWIRDASVSISGSENGATAVIHILNADGYDV